MNSQMLRILKLFHSFKESKQFYLTGGTALSEFYLLHRVSLDLDLFLPFAKTKKNSPDILKISQNLANSLQNLGYKTEWFQKHSQCGEFGVFSGNEKTRVNLAFDTAPLLNSLTKKAHGVSIASFQDVAAGKLAAFYERMEHRDIIDIYYILKKIKSLKLFKLAKKRWAHLDLYQIAKQFDKVDAILPPLDAFKGFLYDKKLKREAIASFFKTESAKILNEILKL